MTQRLCDVTATTAGGVPQLLLTARREEHAAYHLFHHRRHVQPEEAAKRDTHCRQNAAGEQSETKAMPAFPPGGRADDRKGTGDSTPGGV